MIKDVWFRGAATCMGPRERYSPGPSLTLNGPGWPVEKKIKIHKMGIRGRLAASMQANYIFVIRLGVLILYGSKLAIFLFKEVTPLIQRRAIAQPVMIICLLYTSDAADE